MCVCVCVCVCSRRADACALFVEGVRFLEWCAERFGAEDRQFMLAARYARRLPGAHEALREELQSRATSGAGDGVALTSDAIEAMVADARRCERCLELYEQLRAASARDGGNDATASGSLECEHDDEIEWEADDTGNGTNDNDAEIAQSKATLFNELSELRRMIVVRHLPKLADHIAFLNAHSDTSTINRTSSASNASTASISVVRETAENAQELLVATDNRCSALMIPCIASSMLQVEIGIDVDL